MLSMNFMWFKIILSKKNKVDNLVPKIPKMPVEMRMLTYYQESCEMNSTNGLKVTNFSSRDSNSNSFLKRRTSADNVSYNSVNNLKTDNVYKPFKQEKAKGNTH